MASCILSFSPSLYHIVVYLYSSYSLCVLSRVRDEASACFSFLCWSLLSYLVSAWCFYLRLSDYLDISVMIHSSKFRRSFYSSWISSLFTRSVFDQGFLFPFSSIFQILVMFLTWHVLGDCPNIFLIFFSSFSFLSNFGYGVEGYDIILLCHFNLF